MPAETPRNYQCLRREPDLGLRRRADYDHAVGGWRRPGREAGMGDDHAGLDKTARVWEAETGRLLAILTGHAAPFGTATYSPDGKRIVTVGENAARVWDTSQEMLTADQIAAMIRCKVMARFYREDSSLIVPNLPNPAECLPSLSRPP